MREGYKQIALSDDVLEIANKIAAEQYLSVEVVIQIALLHYRRHLEYIRLFPHSRKSRHFRSIALSQTSGIHKEQQND